MALPEHAPMHDGCSQVARNLERSRPMFEGVDSASLNDMIFHAEVELKERDPGWADRPDLAELNRLLSNPAWRPF